jgi:CBS domain-containing protein
MDRSVIITLLALGVALVISSLLLRVRTAGKYEVKTIDLAFIVIPLLVVALATGKVQGLDLFGLKADLSKLWVDAAETKIDSKTDASTASVQDAARAVMVGAKGGEDDLERLIARKVEGLEFRLGGGGYYNGAAIKKYFEALSGSSHLRVVVVNNSAGKLVGIYNAPDLISYLRVAGDRGYDQFEQLMNRGDARALPELAKLPGFLSAEQAVTSSTSKRDALASMDLLNTDTLPIVDQDGKFTGTVERAKLTAKLILAVTDKLAGR